MSGSGDETFAEQTAERLIADILHGVLKPGEKLRVEALKAQYGVGASPIREALARLTSLGFVVAASHRGFRVTAMSAEDLADITLVRQLVETVMVEQSIVLGGDEWEIGIVTAFARLTRALAHVEDPADAARFRSFEAAHKLFHRALVAACPSARLTQMQDLLFDQALRYRDLMYRSLLDRADVLANHEMLMNDVLSRDPGRAGPALRAHLALTPMRVYATGQ